MDDESRGLIRMINCLNNGTTYAYDLAGNLMKTTYPNGSTIDYRYDNASRLKTIIDYKSDGSLNGLFKYTLDSLGNRTAISSHQPLNAIPSLPDTSYTHNTDNRLLTAGSTTFEYDNNGNLITKTLGGNVTNYTWDFNDMLTQLTSGGNTYTYRYDGLGDRVARIENSAEKRYVSGLAEIDASGNITAYYVYGLGLISKITPSDQAYYYHFDGIGSTVGISDSSGNMVNKYAYDTFGKILNQEEAIPNAFKYVGQFGVMDEGNGLLYMRARLYDTEVGRFITKDPIRFLGGLNMFIYVGNNPINFVDPSGLIIGHIVLGILHGGFSSGGPGALIGGIVLGSLGFAGGSFIAGPPGGIAVGLAGIFVGEQIGSLFDAVYAGQPGYDEDWMVALDQLRAVNKELEEFLNSPEMQEFKRLVEEWNRRTGGIVDGKLCQ